jgi:hypothetical protein
MVIDAVGQVDRRMDSQKDGRMVGRTDRRLDGPADSQTVGQTDDRTVGKLMDGRTDGYQALAGEYQALGARHLMHLALSRQQLPGIQPFDELHSVYVCELLRICIVFY